MKSMGDQLESLARSLGAGLVDPVAYDTAIVARVPARDDPKTPAFPQAIAWLRSHQNADGTWGPDEPAYAHGKTLETLAAALALQSWGAAEDEPRFERAMESLDALAKRLSEETYEGIGFELLLPTLAAEAERAGARVPAAYHAYAAPARDKRRLIAAYTARARPDTPMPWWFSLEMHGYDALDSVEGVGEAMLAPNGSIGASPSSAAWLLTYLRRRGEDSPRIASLLESLVARHDGAIPHLAIIDEFETAFSMCFLVHAGMSMDDAAVRPGLELLRRLFSEQRGLGYYSGFIPDPDDSAMGARVLLAAGQVVSASPVMRFFNGRYFSTYPDERNASVSVNFHCLSTLKHVPPSAEVTRAIDQTIAWIREQRRPSGPPWHDKWVYTPCYAISCAVDALVDLDDTLAGCAVDWLLSHQRPDGGWGAFECSTPEETGHAVLALCTWLRSGRAVASDVLERAQAYLAQTSAVRPVHRLWIGKVLYCPPTVARAVVIAARYALSTRKH
jgi:halimadienyl-diphosphate synthase